MANSKTLNIKDIPLNWLIRPLKEIAKIYDGTHVTPNYVDKGIPFYSVEQVTSNNFIETKFISDEVYNKECERVTIEKGDILMTRIGDVGTAKYIDWDVKASFYVSLALIKKINDYGDTQYLNHFINSTLFKRELNQRTIHVAFPKKINLGEIGECLVALPSLPEQIAIARVLGKQDEIINKTNRLIAQKQLQKKWLMQQLLTGKKRLRGFNGEWKELKFGEITEKFSRKNKKLIDAKVYSVTNTNGFVLQTEHFDREVAGENLSNHKIIKKNEFAYNPARINVGSIAYFNYDIGIISSLYVCFRTNEKISDYFMQQLLKLDHTKHRINSFGEGGVRIYLWYELFEKIKVKLPSIEEQNAISNILKAADKEIQLLKAKADKLKEQKRGLMQQLLTGKKRLKYENI